jgi:hypothetical protein
MALIAALAALSACGTGLSGQLETELPAEFRECRPETYAFLQDRGVPRSSVESIFNVPERRRMVRADNDDTEDRIVGYSNWVRLDSCDGSVVLIFNRACQLRRSYGRGDCRLAEQS